MQQICPRLVVGLGNPGSDYSTTRHNIGFQVIDALLASLPRRPDEPRHFAESHIWSTRYAGRALLLQKPLTYMNLSGKAVARLQREQDLLPPEILVIHDDADLPLGRLRLRLKGGSGGHNGVSSIIAELATDNFCRLRLGIGRQDGRDMTDHVLGPFDEVEHDLHIAVMNAAVDAVQTACRRGMETAMNEFNRIDLREPDPPGNDNEESSKETEL